MTPLSADHSVARSGASTARRAKVIGAALALVCGTLIPAQTRLNGELGSQLADGYVAALISFVTGLVIIVVVVLTSGRHRRAIGEVLAAIRTGDQPWWILLGGAVGALLVVSQGLTGAVLGAAIFTVCTVAGQTVSGLVIDRLGLGPAAAMNLTAMRVVGAALTVVAVVVGVSDRLLNGSFSWLALLPLVAGLGISFQSAVNGRVRVIGTLPVASLGNFAVGTVILLVVVGIRVAAVGLPDRLPTDWWLYLSGPIGLAYITINAAVVRHTGVLLLGLASIGGQLLGSLAIDMAFPVAGHQPGPITVLGVLLTLAAIGIASLRPRRRTHP